MYKMTSAGEVLEITKIFVVSHTHWDREWYMPYEAFRMRLIAVVERLFELFATEGQYEHFHFDGQSIILEDIFSICPDYEKRLDELIRDGKVEVGPWYVLPDGFTTGSESLIRNLLIGERITCRHDVNYGQKIHLGYLPDTFGHCSQMPQILKEFGFSYCALWRGISGKDVKTEFIWEGADGSQIKTVHFLDECGYLNLKDISENEEEAKTQITNAVQQYRQYATTSNVLLMNGYDHQLPQKHVGQIINNLAENGFHIIHAKLTDYIQDTFAEIADKNIALDTYRGELCEVNKNPDATFNTVLKGCYSSRSDVKIEDFQTESLLLRYAEPFMVMGMLRGGKYRDDFLYTSWKYLVQNHAHDSIDGCSIGEVNSDMKKRYTWSRTISAQCAKEGMHQIASQIKIPENMCGLHMVHLFNSLPYELENIVEFSVETDEGKFFKDIDIFDWKGNKLESQIGKIYDCGRVDNLIDQPIGWQKKRNLTVRAGVKLPAFGYTTVFVKTSDVPVIETEHQISQTFGILENESLLVSINPNGTLDIQNKSNGKTLSGGNYFKDSIDIGDLYIYSPPHQDIVTTTLFSSPQISQVENGPVSATYKILYRYAVPRDYDVDCCRAAEETNNIITSYVTLNKGERFVRIRTLVENTAKQHRLRVVFPTDAQDEVVLADSHFDVVKRSITGTVPEKRDALIEAPSGCGAQKRFLIYADTFLCNKGIQEYEITKGHHGNQIEMTLLRCVGKIGQKKTLKTTVMPGPEYIESPEGQCLGKYEFEYALGIGEENPNQAAEQYLNAAAYMENNGGDGALPLEDSFFELDNSRIKVSAIKKAEKSDDIIIRLYNPWEQEETATLKVKCRKAELVNLKEEKKAELTADGNLILLHIKPKKIMTIKIKK